MDIAARFLPELSRKHYGPISRELGLTTEEIQAAEKVIAGLDPHPGRAFQPAEPTVYVRPDVFIVELDGELKAILNEYYLPHISISSYYVRLLKESDEKDTREYLRQKMQQAKWLLNNLERRSSTLRRCADAILEAQRPFFAGETGEFSPMSLSSLADTLELTPPPSPGPPGQISAMPSGHLSPALLLQPRGRGPGTLPPGSQAEASGPGKGRGPPAPPQ